MVPQQVHSGDATGLKSVMHPGHRNGLASCWNRSANICSGRRIDDVPADGGGDPGANDQYCPQARHLRGKTASASAWPIYIKEAVAMPMAPFGLLCVSKC
jgi:hypothetical protein